MRTLFGSIASLLLMLVAGCNTVDPDECWVNTSGGFDDEQPIPIGAGVGATSSGDFGTPPAAEPLDYGGEPNPCMAPEVDFTIPIAKPSDFPFVTIIPDDGTDTGGGEQMAEASLPFTRIHNLSVRRWYCSLTIRMPLRTELMGKISASQAAILSAEVTNIASKRMDFTLPEGIFCDEFPMAVLAAFKEKYKYLGARVTK
ncbi:hypothetical protein [Polyangium jinanense]|uniref:Lipoprotein n=1 Tax=Polyangium jinanense TaxID=2829994 RepID=A0A9X4AT98_9BACT|nr:hypothetical protein [Polyangium jinanense]MDC3954062.1 hypothetical protein [Polyangium jinanense]MDC3981982.1 hypothetical protein [Polyangium jinanense]